MEWISEFIGLFQNADTTLMNLLRHHGLWTYLILFILILCATGFIITSFLPADPILMVVGTFCATGPLNIRIAIPLLVAAAVLGNILNFWIGSKLGPKVFTNEKSRIFKKENLQRAHQFYEKYGGITIIASSFFAILRAFAPLIAGIANMPFGKFFLYNIAGCISWITLFTFIGFFFGKLHVVQDNATLMMILLIVGSFAVLPFLIGISRKFFKKQPIKEIKQPGID